MCEKRTNLISDDCPKMVALLNELSDLHPLVAENCVLLEDIIYVHSVEFIGPLYKNFADKYNAVWEFIGPESDTIKLWWR